jgi:sugar phosphate isomerase/epimerase
MREVVIPTFVYMSQSIVSALARFAADGVQLIELHGDAPDTHIDMMDDAVVDAIAQAVHGLPLEVHSVHCAFSQPNEEAWDISQPDEGNRGAALRNRVKVLTAAARLEAHHVVIHPGVGHRSAQRLAHSRAGLAQLAEAAQAAGTRIAIENLPPDQLGGSVAEVEHLLDGLDPVVAGFCLDTGHAMLGDDSVIDYTRALGHRLFGIHWHGNDHADDAHLYPDVSDAKWDDFVAALDEVGYDLPVTLEAVPPDGTPLPEALRSVRAALQSRRAPRPA